MIMCKHNIINKNSMFLKKYVVLLKKINEKCVLHRYLVTKYYSFKSNI